MSTYIGQIGAVHKQKITKPTSSPSKLCHGWVNRLVVLCYGWVNQPVQWFLHGKKEQRFYNPLDKTGNIVTYGNRRGIILAQLLFTLNFKLNQPRRKWRERRARADADDWVWKQHNIAWAATWQRATYRTPTCWPPQYARRTWSGARLASLVTLCPHDNWETSQKISEIQLHF